MVNFFSRVLILSTNIFPIPGIENTDSTKTDPVKMFPKSDPAIVIIGINALRKACLIVTTQPFKPLASAVRMYLVIKHLTYLFL